MKQLVISLLIICSSSVAFAQYNSSTTARPAASSSGDAAALSPGTLGISLGVLGGNPYAAGSAGISYFFTDSLAGGLNLGLRLENGGDAVAGLTAGPAGGDWGLLLAPNIRYFFKTGHRVSPFLIGKLNLAAVDQEGADGESDNEVYLGLMVGIGAEFFPYDYFSFGGHFGVNLNMVEDFGLGFLTSAMHVNFYF